MTVWFTGDHHFGHANIMRHCGRPFSTVDEMDEALVENWNSLVKTDDLVYHVGDFAWWRWPQERIDAQVKKLHGRKYLIYGNHDRDGVKASQGWAWKGDYRRIKIDDQDICLFHYACRVWDKAHYGSWQLYGHSHGSLPDDEGKLATDVGVDRWDYKPVSLEQLREFLKDRKFVPVDHRRGRAQTTGEQDGTTGQKED